MQEIARSFEAVDIQLKAMTGVEKYRQEVNRIEQRETADQFKGKEVIVVTETVILVVTVFVRQGTPSVRGVTR